MEFAMSETNLKDIVREKYVAQVGVLRVIRARCHRLWFQRHAALGAIAGMVLLDLRVHRTRVNGLGPRGLDLRRRAVAVLNHSFTHGFVSGFDWHGLSFLLNRSLHGGVVTATTFYWTLC